MSGRDPAALRFAIINLTRMAGVAAVVIGILIATDRLLVRAPAWLGYILIAAGLIGALVAPALLIRKWRTPR